MLYPRPWYVRMLHFRCAWRSRPDCRTVIQMESDMGCSINAQGSWLALKIRNTNTTTRIRVAFSNFRLAFAVVLVLCISSANQLPCVLILHQRSGPHSVLDMGCRGLWFCCLTWGLLISLQEARCGCFLCSPVEMRSPHCARVEATDEVADVGNIMCSV